MLSGSGRRGLRAALPDRFEKAVDRAAMRSGTVGTDAYLAEWRKAPPVAVEGDADSALAATVARLEAEYDDNRLARLIDNDGWA